jgi:glycine betaine/proline transport system substrate-binding protein
MNGKWRYVWSGMLLLLIGLGIYSASFGDGREASSKPVISIADGGWDSMQVHNYIAAYIIEHGFQYPVEFVNGSSIATFTGLRTGEIDVYMELWYVNMQEHYEEALEAGEIVELSANMVTDDQGFYVPTYIIEGDVEKGIEPVAPDLKTVEDLKNYPEVFQDPEDPEKGMIIGTETGTVVHDILKEKVTTYGLDDTFNYFTPGSSGAVNASLEAAILNHEGWVGYQWSPTWAMAKYDLTQLEEPAYDEEIFNENYGTAFPDNPAYITVHSDFPERAPDVTAFLSNYQTSTDITGEALLYMQEQEASAEEAALWFLENYEDLWTEWIPDEIAERVAQALEEGV